ncbi:MAG: hypothetical protein LJE96_22750 [Deltaproteobacteria bacterium]|nr:hypothetical protein [Deltaproteobacteria bacterium]
MKMAGIIAKIMSLLLLCLFLIPIGMAAAEEEPLAPGEGTTIAETGKAVEDVPTAGLDVAFLSQYIWRGYELSKDSLVIQPSATVGYKGFSFNLWGNLDTDVYAGPNEGNSKWNETDMTVAYDHSFGPLGVGVGYIYYALDGTDDTQEFYLSLGGDVLLAPTLTIYYDVDEYPGWYFDLGISHSFELPYDMSVDLGASIAYYISDNNSIVDYNHDLTPTTSEFNNFQNGLVSVGMTIPFLKYFTATPMIAYSFPLGNAADKLLKATSLGNSADHLFGGVTLSMAF